MIKEIIVKSAIHYHDVKFASNHDLNIYRGCEHKCKYCFAQYSQRYLESDFFDDIFVKVNIAEVLEKELGKKSWERKPINISGICDCYQPLEEKYKLMPQVLELLIKYKNPTIILTKSSLILRDFELIKKLATITHVQVGVSVTTMDEKIREKLEPNASPTMDRLNALKKFTETNCETNVLLMPIIPYLTDNIGNLEEIYKKCNEYKVDNVIASALHLRGDLKNYFYSFLRCNFPETFKKIQHLYYKSYVGKDYNIKLHNFLHKLEVKYNFSNSLYEKSKDIVF
jgi:DNA repair photolyase